MKHSFDQSAWDTYASLQSMAELDEMSRMQGIECSADWHLWSQNVVHDNNEGNNRKRMWQLHTFSASSIFLFAKQVFAKPSQKSKTQLLLLLSIYLLLDIKYNS